MDDNLVKVSPLLDIVGDWRLYLSHADDEDADKICRHERTVLALGSDSFLESLEHSLIELSSPRRQCGKRW
jgi:putative transposase